MIRDLTIRRFKTLVELKLELGRVNVFIGANGSGKSNLLEALGVLSAAAYGDVDDESLQRRGVRPGVPQLYRSAFPQPNPVQDIDLEAKTADGASLRVTLWNPGPSSDEHAWRFKTETLRDAGGRDVISRSPASTGDSPNSKRGWAAREMVALEPGSSALALMELLIEYAIYCPNTPTLRGMADAQQRDPVGLSGGRLPQAIVELERAAEHDESLAEALGDVRGLLDWASDFAGCSIEGMPLSPSAARSPMVVAFHDRFMAPERNLLTGHDASEGALYILYYAVLALHPKAPRCVAVDNLDQALNPRMARRLAESLCAWTKRNPSAQQQWLVTAHNPGLLDGLPLGDPEVRLFAVDRDSRGHTDISRIDLAKASQLRPDETWTLSRMWMNGLLGGLPNV
jgi:predicted ATPase